MGVTGLIKFVDEATTPTNVSSLRGSTVAVDSYYLLHKGSYSCAERLVQGIKTTGLIDYAMKYVRMLLRHKIRVIMVFDGRALKAKAQTESRRKLDREAAKTKAAQLLREGNVERARKEFTKAVNITHEHALELMEVCRKLHVDCIVAMYEADAQLAYLNKIGLAEYVISEDSDLILFGCKKIIYKLSHEDESCVLFDSSLLHLTLKQRPDQFSFETFRRICILSGCDYLDNITGIGLAKATKFFQKTHETDMHRALRRIPSYLKMSKITVTKEYIEGFLKAEATFKHMFVYDPIESKMVRLNEIESDETLKYCSNAGEELDPKTAYQLALGNINPRTMRVVHNYDPFVPPTTHFSIWKSGSAKDVHFKPRAQKPIPLFFVKFAVSPQRRPEVEQIAREENKIEDFQEDDLITSYCDGGNTSVKSEANTSKRPYSILKDIEETDANTSMHNPFAKKRKAAVLNSSAAHNLSLLKSIKENQGENDNENKVVSRFFKPKDVQKTLEENRSLYATTKGSYKKAEIKEDHRFILDPANIIIGEDDDSYRYDAETKVFTATVRHSPQKVTLAYDKWLSSRGNRGSKEPNTLSELIEAANIELTQKSLFDHPEILSRGSSQSDLVSSQELLKMTNSDQGSMDLFSQGSACSNLDTAPTPEKEAHPTEIAVEQSASQECHKRISSDSESEKEQQQKKASYAILANLKQKSLFDASAKSQPAGKVGTKRLTEKKSGIKKKASDLSQQSAIQAKLSKFGFTKKKESL